MNCWGKIDSNKLAPEMSDPKHHRHELPVSAVVFKLALKA